MRIFGLVCTRNEADRWLTQTLAWHDEILDGIFVYDDRSTDDTVAIAQRWATVVTRPEDTSSFMEHEGEFRQAAWEAFELHMQPSSTDWVLAFDADEFLVTTGQSERRRLETVSDLVIASSYNAAEIHFHEIFGHNPTGQPLIRVDGYWADIAHPRFFRYQHHGHFATNRPMGGGSVPTYVDALHVKDPVFLHCGYARETDQRAKYERYSSKLNNGHSNAHIESILQPAVTEPWTGFTPW